MAKAASAPSAAATTTHWTARDASPATNSPGRWVVSYLPVSTVPFSFIRHPRRVASSDCCSWPGREKQRAPIERRAGGEHDPLEAIACPSRRTTRSSRTRMPWRSRRARSSGAISDGPSVQSTRSRLQPVSSSDRPSAALAAAVDRERLIAHFPAVAVRTVEDAHAVELAEAGNVRQVVGDAGRDQQLARLQRRPVGERDVEPRVAALGGGDLDVADLHGLVRPQLLARDPQELARRRCRRARGTRAWRARRRCADGRVSQTSTRRRQRPRISAALSPAGPRADDDDVVHDIMVTHGIGGLRARGRVRGLGAHGAADGWFCCCACVSAAIASRAGSACGHAARRGRPAAGRSCRTPTSSSCSTTRAARAARREVRAPNWWMGMGQKRDRPGTADRST